MKIVKHIGTFFETCRPSMILYNLYLLVYLLLGVPDMQVAKIKRIRVDQIVSTYG